MNNFMRHILTHLVLECATCKDFKYVEESLLKPALKIINSSAKSGSACKISSANATEAGIHIRSSSEQLQANCTGDSSHKPSVTEAIEDYDSDITDYCADLPHVDNGSGERSSPKPSTSHGNPETLFFETEAGSSRNCVSESINHVVTHLTRLEGASGQPNISEVSRHQNSVVQKIKESLPCLDICASDSDGELEMFVEEYEDALPLSQDSGQELKLSVDDPETSPPRDQQREQFGTANDDLIALRPDQSNVAGVKLDSREESYAGVNGQFGMVDIDPPGEQWAWTCDERSACDGTSRTGIKEESGCVASRYEPIPSNIVSSLSTADFVSHLQSNGQTLIDLLPSTSDTCEIKEPRAPSCELNHPQANKKNIRCIAYTLGSKLILLPVADLDQISQTSHQELVMKQDESVADTDVCTSGSALKYQYKNKCEMQEFIPSKSPIFDQTNETLRQAVQGQEPRRKQLESAADATDSTLQYQSRHEGSVDKVIPSKFPTLTNRKEIPSINASTLCKQCQQCIAMNKPQSKVFSLLNERPKKCKSCSEKKTDTKAFGLVVPNAFPRWIDAETSKAKG